MFLDNIFFWLIEYNKDERNLVRQKLYAFITLGFLIVFNLLALIQFISLVIDLQIFEYIQSYNIVERRFGVIPFFCSPIFLILILHFWRKPKLTNRKYRQYRQLTEEDKKMIDKNSKTYVVITIVLLFLSLLSPLIKLI